VIFHNCLVKNTLSTFIHVILGQIENITGFIRYNLFFLRNQKFTFIILNMSLKFYKHPPIIDGFNILESSQHIVRLLVVFCLYNFIAQIHSLLELHVHHLLDHPIDPIVDLILDYEYQLVKNG